MMAIFRSSFLMSGHPVTPPRRTLARFQRLGFNASLTTFNFVRQSCLLDRIQKNTMLYSDGALAWPKVSKEMRKGFRIKQVSHHRQEFLRGRNIGTQIADSRWKSMQSWIPKTVKTLYRGRLNKKLMIYVRSWQFRFAHQHQYIQTLGKLFKTKNAD